MQAVSPFQTHFSCPAQLDRSRPDRSAQGARSSSQPFSAKLWYSNEARWTISGGAPLANSVVMVSAYSLRATLVNSILTSGWVLSYSAMISRHHLAKPLSSTCQEMNLSVVSAEAGTATTPVTSPMAAAQSAALPVILASLIMSVRPPLVAS